MIITPLIPIIKQAGVFGFKYFGKYFLFYLAKRTAEKTAARLWREKNSGGYGKRFRYQASKVRPEE